MTDTGIGIAQDKIATIFSAFSQADQTTTRRFGGTGLGLSIAQRLVAAMGGEISVTSEEGRGSTFSFSLEAGADGEMPAWPMAAHTGARAIVCVEGAATREALVAYLSASGYRVAAVERTALAGEASDAALLIAGVRELEQAGETIASLSVPVIALARLGESGIENLQSRGIADASLEQPLSRRDLLQMLICLREGRDLREAGSQHRKAEQAVRFEGARVLVVDDGAVNREVAQEALRGFGIAVEMVCDGIEAVEACARQSYDLVLMDGSMPGMDGFDATRAIRAAELTSGRPRQAIVAMTAHVVGRAADAWRDAGMDGVLHKPFTLASMAECLGQFIARQEMGPASAIPAEPETGNEDAVLDAALVAQLREMAAMGRVEFVARVVALYREHAPAAFVDIATATAAGDAEAMAQAAHALKSMSYNAGAKQVAALAGALEKMGRSEGRIAGGDELEKLKAAIAAACEQLSDMAQAA